MKNPLLFLAINDYICSLIGSGKIKNIKVVESNGQIQYDLNGKTFNIPPIQNPQPIINRTAAGLMIAEGYVTVSSFDNVSVVLSPKGDTYFVNGVECSCPDRFPPCKHVIFAEWNRQFRKQQVELLLKIEQ